MVKCEKEEEAMTYKFVADHIKPPFQVKTEKYILRKLTVDEVDKDYQAVMSSKESLRKIFCDNDDWPSDQMTLEDNYNDLLEHQKEFDNREGFAYTLVTPDDQVCIGCVYIYPFIYGNFDCRVYYWLTDDFVRLTGHLHNFIIGWLKDDFELMHPVFPGRDFSHEAWKEMVEQLKTSR